MPELTWRARTAQGLLVQGNSEANDPFDLARRLRSRGLTLTAATQIRNRQRSVSGTRISRRERILLTRQFSDALDAGIPVIEVLRDFAETHPNPKARRMLDSISHEVEGGGTLHESLSRFPRVFSEEYVQAVRAGEATGKLERVFEDLSQGLERDDELISKVRSALTYPAILLCAVAGVTVLFLTVLLPKFQPLFAMAGNDLPAITKLFIGMSRFLGTYWYLFAVGVPAGVILFGRTLRTQAGRHGWDRIKLAIPLVRSIVQHLAIARYSRALSMLLDAGLALPTALEVSAATVGNAVLTGRLQAVKSRVVSGQDLARSLKPAALFSPLDLRVIATGEKGGRFAHSFGTLSRLHERTATRKLQGAVLIIEPLLMMLMGGVVLALALSVFLPIYQALDTIGG